jgi:tetratricopeptide (TPR) repeat protein
MADNTGKAKTEELSAAVKITDFIQNNRGMLIVLLAVVVIGVAGFIAFYTVRNVLQKNAVVKYEEFERRLEELGDPGELAGSDELKTLQEEINAFAASSFGYAAGKAYSLSGSIYAAGKNWKEAEESWLASSQKADRLYLAPLSLYNAAAAAEEQGKLDTAIEYYGRTLTYSGLFPAAVRAQFSIGRLYEKQNNKEAAIEAYRTVIEKWPNDPYWTNFAHSRIISLGL